MELADYDSVSGAVWDTNHVKKTNVDAEGSARQ